MQGKKWLLKTLVKNLHFTDVFKLFNDLKANWKIATTGDLFPVSLCDYNVPPLRQLKYILYKKLVCRYNLNIIALPPSLVTAQQHSLTVYHQVKTVDWKKYWRAMMERNKYWFWAYVHCTIACFVETASAERNANKIVGEESRDSLLRHVPQLRGEL